MKKFLLGIFSMSLFLFSAVSSEALTAPVPGEVPVLICTKDKAKPTEVQLIIGPCGYLGCVAQVTKNQQPVLYSVKRLRYADGSLDYVPGPRAGKNPVNRCTFKISKLQLGGRRVTNTPTCAPELRRAGCMWLYPPVK